MDLGKETVVFFLTEELGVDKLLRMQTDDGKEYYLFIKGNDTENVQISTLLRENEIFKITDILKQIENLTIIDSYYRFLYTIR